MIENLKGVEYVEMPLDSSLYSIKCPHKMKPTRIVIHNTANDATAQNEVKYMQSNTRQVSFHYAVDDCKIIKALPTNRNAWHSGDGNGKGNREGIAIEICYSRSGGERFLAAQRNAAALCADLLKEYGWGIDKITKHQDYSGKKCPHRTLEYGWDNFLKLVAAAMNNAPAQQKTSVTYKVYDNALCRWLPDVCDRTDFAGLLGHSIGGIYINANTGSVDYCVHTLGGRWLPTVRDRTDFAGIPGRAIDGLCIKSESPVQYQVHIKNGGWLSAVSSKNADINDALDGFAGILGREIDAVYVWGE